MLTIPPIPPYQLLQGVYAHIHRVIVCNVDVPLFQVFLVDPIRMSGAGVDE